MNFKEVLKDAVAGRKLIRATAYVINTDSKEEAQFFEALNQQGFEIKMKDLQIFAGGAKKADWDVGITLAEKPIDGQEFLKLKSMVAEIADDLVRGVDLINLDAAPGWFVRAIDCEPVFLGGNEQGFIYFKGVLDGAKRDRAA